MARTDISVQTITPTGLEPTYTAAILDGHMFINNGVEFLHVINASGGSINVTVTTPATVDGLAIDDLVVAVPAGTDRMIGTFRTDVYNQSTGADRRKVYIDTSSQTSVTYAVIRP